MIGSKYEVSMMKENDIFGWMKCCINLLIYLINTILMHNLECMTYDSRDLISNVTSYDRLTCCMSLMYRLSPSQVENGNEHKYHLSPYRDKMPMIIHVEVLRWKGPQRFDSLFLKH